MTHRALGALHFDPLGAHQGDGAWRARWAAWYARGETEGGDATFPPPIDAIETAREHFRSAAAVVDGVRRGRALKGEVAALEWLGRVKEQDTLEERAKLADEAIGLLDPLEDLPSLTYLIGTLEKAGRSFDRRTLMVFADLSIDTLVERLGPTDAAVAITNLISLLTRADPNLALSLAERAEPVVTRSGDANLMLAYYTTSLAALGRSLFDGEIAPSASPLEETRRLLTEGEREGWEIERLIGALILLADAATRSDREEEGLQVWEIAARADQSGVEIFGRHRRLLSFLRMKLWAGAGVNATGRGDFKAAAPLYANAVKAGLDLGLHPFAAIYLDSFIDVGTRGGENLLEDILIVLHSIGPTIEAELGREGVEKLQSLGIRVTSFLLSQETVNTEVLHLLWQAVRAARFGSAVRSGAAHELTDDDADKDLLGRIAALRRDVPITREGTGPGSRIDKDLRLLAFARADTPAPGTTPLERLANLQHRYDELLERRLVRAQQESSPSPFALDEVRSALGERTVLLILYLGQYEEGRTPIALLVTRDELAVHAIPDSSRLLMELKEGDRRESAFSYAREVFRLRETILGGPAAPGELDAVLEFTSRMLIGGLASVLERLAERGYDHLCLIPHGPLHYLPFHLLPVNGACLADHWTVTTLPSLEVLRRSGSIGANRREGLAAFGVTFTGSNPHRLPPLPYAADEAQRIAATFSEQAIVEDAVTESAVSDALCRARYVHIATHGALNLDAPSFQYLVVTPDAASDGVLYAHELLRLDLRGLELVTLSACETALGRFDRADNPRGLPATLLLAGAEAIVGTLWQVDDLVARAFFVELYRRLAGGNSRLEAYGLAQREVRRRFPEPRDWGTFFYIGGW